MGGGENTGAGRNRAAGDRGWMVFSSHGRVLFHLVAHPDATLRASGAALGLTERRVTSIVKDLVEAGMLRVERRGRRNRYLLDGATRLEHPPLAPIPLTRLAAAVVPEAAVSDGAGRGRRRRGQRSAGSSDGDPLPGLDQEQPVES